MKLKGKLLLVSIVPILVASLVIGFYVSEKATGSMKAEIKDALHSTCLLLRENATEVEGNDYYIENDQLFNGTRNLTIETEIMDSIKAETGIVTTLFFGNTRYSTSVIQDDGKRALLTTAGDAVVTKVINNKQEYFAENVNVVGKPYFAYYIPLLDDNGNAVGMVFAGKPQATVNATVRSLITGIILVAVLVIVACFAVAWLVAGAISKRFGYSVTTLASVANGDLTNEIPEKLLNNKDESGDICRSINDLQDKLQGIVENIKAKSGDVDSFAGTLGGTCEKCATTLDQIEHSVQEIAEGATSQATDTTDATEKVIQMGELVERTNESIEKLNEVADGMETSGKAASETLTKLEGVNAKAKDAIEIIYEQTNTTNESAKNIGEAVSLITSIAEETNLLSLNASIEAARAGEQGKGFAVVASQISKLAEQSSESAKKIEEIITSLVEDSEKAVNTMNEVNVIMNNQSEMVAETATAFKEIIEGVKQSRDNASEISENMRQLNKSRQTVTDIVSNLSAIAEENAASTQETSASTTVVNQDMQELASDARRLTDIAEDLGNQVSVFKLK
ncbi:MAG: methyl-accepting chemotaxis protein [Lachnospiraceae bacterium]|nr:methyl-accepting chemotaxis protein [Lachnospiraceae bacterium]